MGFQVARSPRFFGARTGSPSSNPCSDPSQILRDELNSMKSFVEVLYERIQIRAIPLQNIKKVWLLCEAGVRLQESIGS